MRKIILNVVFTLISTLITFGNNGKYDEALKYVEDVMNEGEIPGLSLIIQYGDEINIECFGYADIESKEKVTPQTLFELGSVSKSFTALAILHLDNIGLVDLNDSISTYLPWFKTYYNNQEVSISLNHFMHHTSGIPWNTISLIPKSNSDDALRKTIEKLNNLNLKNYPGTKYEYATINFDVLALVLEQVTGQSFESYMAKHIFSVLELSNTYIGKQLNDDLISSGYKIGFFKPRRYKAPIYRGNNAAGYVVSCAEDMSKWLQYQMHIKNSVYDSLIINSHTSDESIRTDDNSSYAAGWFVSSKGDGEIYHAGMNPNYSSFVTFSKDKGIGVAVLVNSNSSHTQLIGQNVMKILSGEEVSSTIAPENSRDKMYSVISIIISIYLLFVLAFLAYVVYGIAKRKRNFVALNYMKVGKLIIALIVMVPFLYGIYMLPKIIAGFSWESALVWVPISFPVAIILVLIALGLSYVSYIITMLFPEKSKYLKDAPRIIILSILSGIANMVVMILITSSFKSSIEPKYILGLIVMALIVYLFGRKIVQTRMIYLTRSIIYDLRMKLVEKVFSTSFEKFEKIERGRVYSTMNDDIGTLGQSANTFIMLTTSLITVGSIFIYMATLAFWATLITILLICTLSAIFYIVSRKARPLFEDARETRNVYMGLLNGMIDGFRELSIHREKKLEYKNDVDITSDEYRQKICTAEVKFVNAFLIGDSLLMILLVTVVFAIPKVFPDIELHIIMSFVILLLYLIGPVNMILRSAPQLIQLRVSWNRVQGFLKDIPANLDLNDLVKFKIPDNITLDSIKLEELTYAYLSSDNKEEFSVGPINLELKKGEVLFVIGGNGSGKTTLAKMITGLYTPNKGKLFINEKVTEPQDVGEYFSAVFNPYHLFQKLYNIDLNEKDEELNDILKTLQLQDKVNVTNNKYDTINLSGGQRKRLALLQCYLENKPIYLFDEWAADQDPVYRKYFYRELIPVMKQQGKIIIAITHDDHYFDVADKLLKLEMGEVEYFKSSKDIEQGIFTKALF